MRNFLMGVLLGTLATYWYLVQADATRDAIAGAWSRMSSPPPRTGR